jgi:tetratricopeptide (TPR) repeat protein
VKGIRILLLAAATAVPCAGPRAAPPGGATAQPPPAAAPLAAEDARAAEARAAYLRGADLYGKGRYQEAIAAFEEADRLKPSPALQYNVGQAQEKLGDVPAALAAYARYLRADPRAPNRDAVEKRVRSLEARLATTGLQMLHVTTSPERAEVAVDGEGARPAPVDAPFAPGRHVLSATAPGYLPAAQEVDLPADRSLEVHLVLGAGQDPSAAPLAATPPSPPLEATRPGEAPRPVAAKSWLGPIIAGGVAAVAAGAGLVLGLQARNAQNQLLAGGNDRSQADALVSKANGDATAANVLYGVAGAAALTGGVLAIAF